MYPLIHVFVHPSVSLPPLLLPSPFLFIPLISAFSQVLSLSSLLSLSLSLKCSLFQNPFCSKEPDETRGNNREGGQNYPGEPRNNNTEYQKAENQTDTGLYPSGKHTKDEDTTESTDDTTNRNKEHGESSSEPEPSPGDPKGKEDEVDEKRMPVVEQGEVQNSGNDTSQENKNKKDPSEQNGGKSEIETEEKNSGETGKGNEDEKSGKETKDKEGEGKGHNTTDAKTIEDWQTKARNDTDSEEMEENDEKSAAAESGEDNPKESGELEKTGDEGEKSNDDNKGGSKSENKMKHHTKGIFYGEF